MSVHSPRRPIAPPSLDLSLAAAYPTSTNLMPKLSETILLNREKQQKPPRNCPKLHHSDRTISSKTLEILSDPAREKKIRAHHPFGRASTKQNGIEQNRTRPNTLRANSP